MTAERAAGATGGSALAPASSPVLVRRAFWFLRHGQTDWNAQNLSQGITDVPLNAVGLDQARAAAGLLVGRGVERIVCSPLSRARVTAGIVADRLGVPMTIDADLHEADFGAMDKQPMGAPWFSAWVRGIDTPEGAETFAALRDRAVAAVNRALDGSPVLVVAHGALFRSLRWAMGLDPEVRLANAVPMRCEPVLDGWRLTEAASAT